MIALILGVLLAATFVVVMGRDTDINKEWKAGFVLLGWSIFALTAFWLIIYGIAHQLAQ
jgi:hypothetical protein